MIKSIAIALMLLWSGTVMAAGVPMRSEKAPTHCNVSDPVCIEVDHTENVLWVYEHGKFVYGFPVITGGVGSLRSAVMSARVERIDTAPAWTPGERGRQLIAHYTQDNDLELQALAKRCQARLNAGYDTFSFGHQCNPMGMAKIVVTGFGGRHIHGTESFTDNYDVTRSLGCVRLLNDGVAMLLAWLQRDGYTLRSRVSAGIRVVFYRGESVAAPSDSRCTQCI